MLPSSWRYKRFHISYVITWCAFGVLIGLLVGQWVTLPYTLLSSCIALLLVVGAVRSRRLSACIVITVAGMLIGLARGSEYQIQLEKTDAYAGQTIQVAGIVSQDPTIQNQGDAWNMQLSDIRINETPMRGEIYVTATSENALRRGDVVVVRAKASEGFGSFRLSLYRAIILETARPQNNFLDIRDSFAASVRAMMPEPEASLGIGFVVGQKSALPDDLVDQLKIVGLTHIVVASGYNLTILVRFARRLLSRRSRYLAFIGSVVLVVLFVACSGLSPSMNRAAIVTALSLLAWYYGRQFHPIQLILYVASGSALLYPVYLWSDLGWLLSFAAFTGVLVVAPIFTQMLYKKQDGAPATVQLVVETLSAELMTLPITMVVFGYIPIFALLANILVAPIIPFAMGATFMAGLVGWFLPVASIVAAPASIVIGYVIAVVEKFSGIPGARWELAVSPVFAIGWYGLIALWLGLFWRFRRIDLRASSVVE